MYRLLFYCQDVAGLGHLRRSITIATHLLSVFPESEALLLTRGRASQGIFELPPRCDLVKLPSFAEVGRDQDGEVRALVDREDERYRRARESMLRELVREFDPHFFHVDGEPIGVQGELLPALGLLEEERPGTAVVFGLRDVRGTPEYVKRRWWKEGVPPALARFYRRILVYGESEIFDVAAEYELDQTLADKIRYCGYLVQPEPVADQQKVREDLGVRGREPLVAVTAGGGADGMVVMDAYLRAVPQILRHRRLHSVLVTGPLMEELDLAAEHPAVPPDAITIRQIFDTRSLMAAADAVVCRGGYNSVAEAIALGHEPTVIPRRTRSGEQELRTRLFSERGWCHVVREGELQPAQIADQVSSARIRRPRDIPAAFDPAASLARVEAAVRELLEEKKEEEPEAAN